MQRSRPSSWAKAPRPFHNRGEEVWEKSQTSGHFEPCGPDPHGLVNTWQEAFVELPPPNLWTIVEARMKEAARLASIEERLATLEERLNRVETAAIPSHATLYLSTFAPEPYVLKHPIPIAIQETTDGFLASFVDANINTSGDTQQEAFANARELILDVFDRLHGLPAKKLGPGPARQIAVLKDFIDAAANHEGTRPEDRQEA